MRDSKSRAEPVSPSSQLEPGIRPTYPKESVLLRQYLPCSVSVAWPFDWLHLVWFGLLIWTGLDFHAWGAPLQQPAAGGNAEAMVIRSIEQLQNTPSSVRNGLARVEIEAELSFAGRDWDNFFIQSGSFATMVSGSRQLINSMVNLPIGTRVCVKGWLGPASQFCRAETVEILESEPSELERHVPDISTSGNIAINGLVRVSGRVLEAFRGNSEIALSASFGILNMEFQYFHPLDVAELLPLVDQQLTVRGAVCLQHQFPQHANYNVRMMHRDQLETDSFRSEVEKYRSSFYAKERFDVLPGQVLYSDRIDSVLLATDIGVKRIRTRFALRVDAGTRVVVYTKKVPSDHGTLPLESVLMEEVQEAMLPPSFKMDVLSLKKIRVYPERVTTTATVTTIQEGSRSYRLYLEDAQNKFLAILPTLGSSVVPAVEPGDLIQITGTPIFEEAYEAPEQLTFYAAKRDDLKVLRRLSDFPSRYLFPTAIGLCLVILAGMVWNWQLSRNVSLRTARLNEVKTHLQKSFEAIREGVLINDRNRVLTNKNDRFEAMFGFAPAIGCSIEETLIRIGTMVSNRLEFQEYLQHVLDLGDFQRTMLLKLVSPPRQLQLFSSTIHDRDGRSFGNIWTFEDITEKLQAESDLLQAQKMDAIGQLSGGIAHDFRNLLTVIRSSLRLIQISHKKQRAIEDHCDSAETAIQQASELTQQLLDFSRLSVIQRQTLDINEVVRHAYNLCRRTVDARVQMRMDLCDIPLPVEGDATRLQQVLLNLCINARDAMPSQVGSITLRTRYRSDLDGEHAVIMVDDNGMGMPEEIRSRIFEPFFTTKQSGRGTGLGLSVALGIIEQHGGQIRCTSQIGNGTVFELVLPLSKNVPSPLPSYAPETVVDLPPLRLLVVDDEPLVLATAKSLLESMGHFVESASSGSEALAKLQESHDFDAALLDMTMPGMTGVEVCLAIQSSWPQIGVVICTGYANDTRRAFEEQGRPIPPIVSKPYRVEEIQFVLAQWTSRRGLVS